MQWPIDIVADMTPERFAEAFSACPRPVREALMARYGAKSAVRASLSAVATTAERARFVQRRLASDDAKGAVGLADELLRNWLMARRALLGDTLDAFGVHHSNGITEKSLDFFEKLPAEKAKALCERLIPSHGREAVGVYLRYLKVPGARELCAPEPAPNP